jgi:hypothetical protein
LRVARVGTRRRARDVLEHVEFGEIRPVDGAFKMCAISETMCERSSCEQEGEVDGGADGGPDGVAGRGVRGLGRGVWKAGWKERGGTKVGLGSEIGGKEATAGGAVLFAAREPSLSGAPRPAVSPVAMGAIEWGIEGAIEGEM